MSQHLPPKVNVPTGKSDGNASPARNRTARTGKLPGKPSSALAGTQRLPAGGQRTKDALDAFNRVLQQGGSPAEAERAAKEAGARADTLATTQDVQERSRALAEQQPDTAAALGRVRGAAKGASPEGRAVQTETRDEQFAAQRGELGERPVGLQEREGRARAGAQEVGPPDNPRTIQGTRVLKSDDPNDRDLDAESLLGLVREVFPGLPALGRGFGGQPLPSSLESQVIANLQDPTLTTAEVFQRAVQTNPELRVEIDERFSKAEIRRFGLPLSDVQLGIVTEVPPGLEALGLQPAGLGQMTEDRLIELAGQDLEGDPEAAVTFEAALERFAQDNPEVDVTEVLEGVTTGRAVIDSLLPEVAGEVTGAAPLSTPEELTEYQGELEAVLTGFPQRTVLETEADYITKLNELSAWIATTLPTPEGLFQIAGQWVDSEGNPATGTAVQSGVLFDEFQKRRASLESGVQAWETALQKQLETKRKLRQDEEALQKALADDDVLTLPEIMFRQESNKLAEDLNGREIQGIEFLLEQMAASPSFLRSAQQSGLLDRYAAAMSIDISGLKIPEKMSDDDFLALIGPVNEFAGLSAPEVLRKFESLIAQSGWTDQEVILFLDKIAGAPGSPGGAASVTTVARQ